MPSTPTERVASLWLTKAGAAPDTEVLKWLIARTKKGKGVVQIPMVERAFAVMPGWSIVGTTAHRPLVGLDSDYQLEFLLSSWRARWKVGRTSAATTVKDRTSFTKIEDPEGAMKDFWRQVELVRGKEPTGQAQAGSLYATQATPVASHVQPIGVAPQPIGFEVQRMWLGVPAWIVTAPNHQTVVLPSPIDRKGRPLDPSRLDPWPTFWTWCYKQGLDVSAKEALAKHEEVVADLLLPAAERKRVEQSRLLLPEIVKLLEGMVDKQFQKVWDSLTDRFVAALAMYLEAHDAAWEKDSKTQAYPQWDDYQFFKKHVGLVYFEQFIRRATEPDLSDPKRKSGQWRKRRTNYLDIARAQAKVVATSLRDQFVHKNGTKLSHIARKKGNLASGKTTEIFHGEDFGGEMQFSFEDGSKFTVRNKTVFKISPLGRPFEQFPTTFHDVVMPDGSRMSSPSEQRMLDVFGVA